MEPRHDHGSSCLPPTLSLSLYPHAVASYGSEDEDKNDKYPSSGPATLFGLLFTGWAPVTLLSFSPSYSFNHRALHALYLECSSLPLLVTPLLQIALRASLSAEKPSLTFTSPVPQYRRCSTMNPSLHSVCHCCPSCLSEIIS